MADNEIEDEIERSRAYLHALIDVRFSMAQQWSMKWDAVNPQTYYLWRNREEFERTRGFKMREAIRLHNDRRWSFDPCYGADAELDPTVIAWRTFCTTHGHRHSESGWTVVQPKQMPA